MEDRRGTIILSDAFRPVVQRTIVLGFHLMRRQATASTILGLPHSEGLKQRVEHIYYAMDDATILPGIHPTFRKTQDACTAGQTRAIDYHLDVRIATFHIT